LELVIFETLKLKNYICKPKITLLKQ